jgi:glycosyltransferase involved in cell wall biosynthesis
MALTRSPGTFLCFSHLRWKFVYQRPQHLLSRAARTYRVFFIEEPVWSEERPHLEIHQDPCGVNVVTPRVSSAEEIGRLQQQLYDGLADERLILWYYTPLALNHSRSLKADLVVYDCMDELSAFKFAPCELKSAETELLDRAHLVFTGGHSLYHAKRGLHSNVHAFPSSVDAAHFGHARAGGLADPVDQASLPHPRLGFFGVIDERLDLDLIAGMADRRPDWSFVMIGPVVKIDPASLPQRPNIHWLGGRDYKELPSYLAHWDVGIMPFAMNEATRFISPTKTPEFLAAGLPVVSAPIADVIRPYGALGLAEIAGDPDGFVRRCECLLKRSRKQWLGDVDTFLADLSWDRTWNAMHTLMQLTIRKRRSERLRQSEKPVFNLNHAEAGNAGI